MKIDLRNLDLNLLKAFNALMDEGSVTHAAQRLSLTQPAVSGMLTRLRDYFGDPLFVRAPRGMVPTLRALELAGAIKQILADISTLSQATDFQPATAEMIYTIAATDYALKAVVVPFMAILKKQAPGIRVCVVPVDPQRLQHQFIRGAVDLALVTPQTTPEELHSRILYKEQYVCMLRADHPAAKKSAVSLEDFCQLEHVIVSLNADFWGVTDDALAETGLKRRVGMSVNSFLVLPEILRITDMIAVVPYRLACTHDFLVRMETPLPIPGFSKSMAWHERSHRDPAHQWIRNLLAEVSRFPGMYYEVLTEWEKKNTPLNVTGD